MAMLSIFILFFTVGFPNCMVLSSPTVERLPMRAAGPASFAFDRRGRGPYTSIADGRIVKYKGRKTGFVEYAHTSPNRTRTLCDYTNNTDLGYICGRPLGLGFYYRTGELFVVDAFMGLVVVGPKGGLAKPIARSANEVPFGVPDGLDIDQRTGTVYFTDASSVFRMNESDQLVSTRDATGRLLKYDIRSKKVTVLLSGLSGAAGVAVSKDGSFILVSEFVRARVQKYWLRGPKANTAEIVLNVTGSPNKIRRTKKGDFWLAVTEQTPYLALIGKRITGSGTVLETLNFSPEFNSSMITEVQEVNGALYLGSLYSRYVGIFTY